LRPWLSWIEYLTTNQGVAGSNPAGRAILKGFWDISKTFFHFCERFFYRNKHIKLSKDFIRNILKGFKYFELIEEILNMSILRHVSNKV
jgi:hypothetical protein